MTSRDVLLAVLRRWYLMVLGGLLTLAGLYYATHQPGVYFTKYEVVLLPPATERWPNKIEDPHYSLTEMAGLVVTDYNDGQREPLSASADTLLYGEGIARGSRVRLPNHGSQWRPLYPTPNIDVQVVGPGAEEVGADARSISRRLGQILQQRQDELGVVPSMRITSLVSPTDPVIAYIGGSRSRAAVGAGAVGLPLTTILVVQFDRWRSRRRRRDLEAPPLPWREPEPEPAAH